MLSVFEFSRVGKRGQTQLEFWKKSIFFAFSKSRIFQNFWKFQTNQIIIYGDKWLWMKPSLIHESRQVAAAVRSTTGMQIVVKTLNAFLFETMFSKSVITVTWERLDQSVWNFSHLFYI